MSDHLSPHTEGTTSLARARLSSLIREMAPARGDTARGDTDQAARPDTPPPAPGVSRLPFPPPNGGWADGRTGRLVERWLPGGTRGVDGVRSLADRHRFGVVVLAIVLLTVIGTVVAVAAQRPVAESAPALPAAISAAPTTSASTTAAEPSQLVISVVGKVGRPGLVTLADGARVADALRAAGGVRPNTDDMALNLARKLTDGEQIYVGVPVPPGAAPPGAAADPDAGTSDAGSAVLAGATGDTSGGATAKVDLNTATDDQLETLPGIGPAMAQRILTWRSQHGHFDSINQLRDVGDIGDVRFAKLQNLVTT